MNSEKNVYLRVKVQPRSHKRHIQKIGEEQYKVRVLSPPSEGKANKEVIELIASHFHLPPSRVKITKGQKSRKKVVVLEY